MPTYVYTARELETGRETRSRMEASSEQAVLGALFKRKLQVVSLHELATPQTRIPSGRVPLPDLGMFTRQLATMLEAGLPITQSLQSLADQTSLKVLRLVIRDVRARVEGGDSFSQALRKHPRVFSKLYVRMVEAGERGGLLATILARLALYQENTARLRSRIRSALMYPIAVTVVAVAVTVFLLVAIVPVFREIYGQFGAHLPRPTDWLIRFSQALKQYFLYVLAGLAALSYGGYAYFRTPEGREFWDRWRVRLPLVGPIAHRIALARFARTFAALFRSGVPILEVLDIVAGTCGNVLMEKAIKRAASTIEKGDTIARALGQHALFPAMLVQMLSAGEQTGRVDTMLERVADFWDEEIQTTLAGLMSLIEPILIVVLGTVIGGIVMCMFLPILNLSDLLVRR